MPSDDCILHELPGRIRLRIPALGAPGSTPDDLEDWMDTLSEVSHTRANQVARTLVVHYDKTPGARERILRRLQGYSPPPEGGLRTGVTREPEITPMVISALTILALPWLSRPLQIALTGANIASTIGRGTETLIREGIKVEVLDALAIGLSAARGELYTANLTDFLLSLGHFLERTTERQSDRQLRKLLRPEPAMAWLERDGELIQIPGDQVESGDILQVGTGETIPVDGRVISGTALVNQALVTGEDVPVRKEAPRRVVAGSVLVEGRLRITATQVGAETTTARIARFIQESLDQRSDTQREADRLADQRVYLTLATGAVVYGLTRNLTRLQSVFLVDYSCALKLGTPVAFKSGMSRAAAHGVLMKGGDAIEQLAGVDTLVFDKTGTLTHSELSVTDVIVLRPGLSCNEAALLALVASVEEHASHPVASAIVEAARSRDLQHISHGEVDYLVAHGLSAEVNGEQILVGSRHFLEEHHGIRFADDDRQISALEASGKILLYVGAPSGPVGLIALRDTPRRDAAETMKRLRALGIENLIMITGDRRHKAEALAHELGLDAVHAEVAPEDKAALITGLQSAGRRVAFVGDGVNDGPALVAADVGIAMPRGADIARATADILLMDDRLSVVADARELAVKTMGLIRGNFRAAIGLNTGILAGAIGGVLSPVASALLHNGTTVAILLNALRGVRLASEQEALLQQRMEDLEEIGNRHGRRA
ncbi:heavy metal translocating P-type ATPase [Thiocapsa imhoffii]|uniref:P-type Zn(2+) transporter n=3 Tax=Chromatiaceae TaxID=1046 RepID=A0A9X1BA75_9GAMM|nr:heavy metal translocating P-type ATPase [Thiocapsa imhoffii]MBK1646008.1 heavy metal translocating P-type ATPase [Thiocapsa imhoffii]